MQQKIVLIGGPSTGKTAVINKLKDLGYYCMPEISREVTMKAQKEGIDQLFLENPILFSEMLLEGRENQFLQAKNVEDKIVFFDRGIPGIEAYLKYSKTDYPKIFTEKSSEHKYDKIFYFPPWERIYISDNERYESFEQANKINDYLKKMYQDLGYILIDVPFLSVDKRCEFIIDNLK